MINRSIISIVAVLFVFLASVAFAQQTTPNGNPISLSITSTSNNATFSGIGIDANPAAGFTNAVTFFLNVETGSDILLFATELVASEGSLNFPDTGGLVPFTNPPGAFAAIFLELSAPTFVTTPGFTAAEGIGTLDMPGTLALHFDVTDDGAQTGFNWSQVTLIPDPDTGMGAATLRGQLHTADTLTPIIDDFEITMTVGVPEPGSISLLMFAGLFSFSAVRRRRRRR